MPKRKARTALKAAKKRKTTKGRVSKASIRKALLGVSETKMINMNSATSSATDISSYSETLRHNDISGASVHLSSGGVFSTDANTSNLLYTQQGSDGWMRHGDEIYVQSIKLDVQMQVPETVLVGTTSDAYPTKVLYRIIVGMGPKSKVGTGTWYNTVFNAIQNPGNDYNKMSSIPDNVTYRILYDKVFTERVDNIVYQGSVTDEYNWMPTIIKWNKTFNLNRKFKYTDNDNYTNERMFILFAGYNDNSLAAGTTLGKIRVATQMKFKDV